MSALTSPGTETGITVFNTTATERDECVEVELPAGWPGAAITDKDNHPVPGQRTDTKKWLFRAHVPSLGYAVYHLRAADPSSATAGARATLENNGACHIETDLYSLPHDRPRQRRHYHAPDDKRS